MKILFTAILVLFLINFGVAKFSNKPMDEGSRPSAASANNRQVTSVSLLGDGGMPNIPWGANRAAIELKLGSVVKPIQERKSLFSGQYYSDIQIPDFQIAGHTMPVFFLMNPQTNDLRMILIANSVDAGPFPKLDSDYEALSSWLTSRLGQPSHSPNLKSALWKNATTTVILSHNFSPAEQREKLTVEYSPTAENNL